MNIQVIAAALVPTPPAGFRTLFIDSSNNGILTWKLDNGTLAIFSETEDPDCCSCEIAKEQMKAVACALKNGTISATEYGVIISSGINVTTTESVALNGNKTCTVTVGSNVPTIVGTGVVVSSPNSVNVGASIQAYAVFTPRNTTNQNVTWVSTDTTKATINADGLITGVAAGTTTIRVITADRSISGEKIITVI